MAYGGIDSQVTQRMDAFRGNPNALAQRYQASQELIDLLALQKLKSEKEEAARQMQAMMQPMQGSIKDQREEELRQVTSQDIARQLGASAPPQQQQRPQGQPQGNPPMAPQMAQGLGGMPTPPMRMASGGIVSFAGGGLTGMPGEGALSGVIEDVKAVARELGISVEEAIERFMINAQRNMPNYQMIAPTGLGFEDMLPENAGMNLDGVNQLSRDTNTQGSSIPSFDDIASYLPTIDDEALKSLNEYNRGFSQSLSEAAEENGRLSPQYIGTAIRGGLGAIPAGLDALYNIVNPLPKAVINTGDVILGGEGDLEFPTSPILTMTEAASDFISGDGTEAASTMEDKEKDARKKPDVYEPAGPTDEELGYKPGERRYDSALGFERPPMSLVDEEELEAASIGAPAASKYDSAANKPTTRNRWGTFADFALAASQADPRSGIGGVLAAGGRGLQNEEKFREALAAAKSEKEANRLLKERELTIMEARYKRDSENDRLTAQIRQNSVNAELAKLNQDQLNKLNEAWETAKLQPVYAEILKKEGNNAAYQAFINDRMLQNSIARGQALGSNFDFSTASVTTK